MKNFLFIFLLAVVGLSCSNENTISDDLKGDWNFIKEIITSPTNPFPSIPRIGSVTFDSENKGRGTSFVILPTVVDFDWELTNGELILKIAEANWADPSQGMSTYNISRINDDDFRLEKDNVVITLTRA